MRGRHSFGHGFDLQKSSCHHVIIFIFQSDSLLIFQVVNLLGCKLVSFSACASWSLRACSFHTIGCVYYTVWKTLNHSNTPSISYWMEACHCFIFLFIRSGAYKIYCVKNNNKWNKLFGPNFNFVGSGEHKCHLNYGLRRWGVTGHCVGLASCNVMVPNIQIIVARKIEFLE